MKPVLKEMSCDEHDLESFSPEPSNIFYLNIRFRIGSSDSSGADDFHLSVCTPEWMAKNTWGPCWGRHMLIVRDYDLETIRSLVENYLLEIDGDDWNQIATKISRVLAWEFEDYQP